MTSCGPKPSRLRPHADDVPMKVSGAVAEANLQEQVYRPLIEVLAENDYVPKKVDELAAHAKLKAMPIAQVMQAIFILAGAGHVHPAQETASASRTYCCALNRYLRERARRVGDIQFLASPVIGGAVSVPRFHQMQLSGKSERGMPRFSDSRFNVTR